MEKDAYKKMSDFEETHWWFVARREIIQSVLKLHINNNKSCNILELGSGTGGNIKMLSEFGNVTAIEPDAYAVELSRKKNESTVIKSQIETLDINKFNEKFDIILLLDVLEHIKKPSLALQKIKQLSCSNTIVIITTPAYQFLWGPHDIEHHHYRRYTKKNLSQLISNNGFNISRVSYINTLLFPLVLVSRLINKFFSKKIINDSRMPPDFLNKSLKNIFSSEKHLLKGFNLPYGCSLIATCKVLPPPPQTNNET